MSKLFKDRLKAIRETRRLSQAQLAEKTGLQITAISHFETGTRSPSFDNLRKLADALEVSSDYLIGRSDEQELSADFAGKLFRNARALSTEDLKFLEEMAANLAKRNKEE